MRAVQITEFGGPEVLQVVELPDPVPGEGETVVEVERAGINFADTHQRHNSYLAKAELPLIPGAEVSGRTADGRRVAAVLPNGGYAQRVAVPESALVPIPDEVGYDEAAAILLQGLTAWALLRISANVQAGRVGRRRGGRGGDGHPRRPAREVARRPGHRPRLLRREAQAGRGPGRRRDRRLAGRATSPAAILAANDGEEVDVVLQMSGGAAFEEQMSILAPFGRMVAFGIATREPNLIKSQKLMRTSRAVVGFWIVHLLAAAGSDQARHRGAVRQPAGGELRLVIGATYPLERAAEAQIDLAERRTQGKLLLDPSA